MSIMTGNGPIPVSNHRMLNTANLEKIHISEASESVYKGFVESLENMLEFRHTTLPDVSNDPRYQPHSRVTVNGKVIATIDNNGFVQTSNGLGASLRDGLPGQVNGKSGPDLALARAAYIADLMGGKMEKSASAMTQRQFDSISQPASFIDYNAMHNDPAYESLLQIKQARTLFLARELSSGGNPDLA